MLDAANLFPPAVAFCLSGLFVRNRPVASTAMMVCIIAWNALFAYVYLSADWLTSAYLLLLQWVAGFVAIILATIVRLAGNVPSSDAKDILPPNRPAGVLLFTIACFVGGVMLGLGLCWSAFNFEFTGGPGSGVNIQVFGLTVVEMSGLLVGFVPVAVYIMLSGLMGIAGAFVGSRLSSPP
jgi:hypothetical protein